MSVTFDAVINPIILFAGVLAGIIVGIGYGKARLKRSQIRVRQIENELMHSHTETLDAQRAYVALERGEKDLSIPVISMKISGGKENSKESAHK